MDREAIQKLIDESLDIAESLMSPEPGDFGEILYDEYEIVLEALQLEDLHSRMHSALTEELIKWGKEQLKDEERRDEGGTGD